MCELRFKLRSSCKAHNRDEGGRSLIYPERAWVWSSHQRYSPVTTRQGILTRFPTLPCSGRAETDSQAHEPLTS